MNKKYGNTFSQKVNDAVSASVQTIWPKADEFYPTGAWVAKDETYTEGKLIPAGTPVGIDKIGGTVTIGSAATAPVGLSYEDATVGSLGCSLTIVTKGVFNESLSNAAITAAQKNKLYGITFIKEA